MKYSLGIDTSNYKTSIALTDMNGDIVYDKRILLNVDKGKRGLRQQEALFQHINNLPILFDDMFNNFDADDISCVSVSDKPRSVSGSYMPAFLAGVSQAKVLAGSLKCPLYRFSHQDGHVRAASRFTELCEAKRFISLHFSGGTTEVLLYENGKLTIIGGTKDISFGQLLDRIGTKLGLDFPCGEELDTLAYEYLTKNVKAKILVFPKIKTNSGYINLSGIESAVFRFIDGKTLETDEKNQLILGIFSSISTAILDMLDEVYKKYAINDFLFAGGVSSSKTLRRMIGEAGTNFNSVFCEPELSSDNAIGISLLGGEKIWR